MMLVMVLDAQVAVPCALIIVCAGISKDLFAYSSVTTILPAPVFGIFGSSNIKSNPRILQFARIIH